MSRRAPADRWHPCPSTVVVCFLEDVRNGATDGNVIPYYKEDVQRVGVVVC